jgi:hypothetical protein
MADGLLAAWCGCGRGLGVVELTDGTFVLVHDDCREADHEPVIADCD